MDNKIELQQTVHLLDLDAMEKDIKKSQWYILNLESNKRTIMMTKPQILEYVNRAFSKQFTLDQIDTQKIFGHRDNVYMILVDQSGDR